MHALQDRRMQLSASNAALEAENFQLTKLLKEAPRSWDTTVIDITVCTDIHTRLDFSVCKYIDDISKYNIIPNFSEYTLPAIVDYEECTAKH